MHNSIALIFEEHTKVNSRTKFAVNLMNMHTVICVFCIQGQTSVTAIEKTEYGNNLKIGVYIG